MGKKKEEIEAEKKREIVKQLRKGPDLEQYVEGKKRKFTTYARGASLYSMNYYSFVTLAKEAGANIQIKKKVIVDLDILEKYILEGFNPESLPFFNQEKDQIIVITLKEHSKT